MENGISDRRGLILILIIASAVVFVGLVWIIATYFPWNRLGFSAPGDITNTPRIELNCTYPVSYWVEHPELYPPQIILGSKVYQANDIHEALSHADEGLVELLLAQLVGVFLNTSAGADQDIIEATIFQAYRWLVEHPDESQIPESDRVTGLKYLSLLEAYNLGQAGVPLCEGIYIAVLPQPITASVAPTLILTTTPSQTPTTTPSETASPVVLPVTATYIIILPTNTAIRTTQPPIQLPSNTPIQPTDQPPPTNTPRPPVPPTNTPPPPPVPTFTLPPLPPATYTLPPPP